MPRASCRLTRASKSATERFRGSNAPDPAFARLLTSGEGVIWLPGDVCLWRHWDEESKRRLCSPRFLPSASPAAADALGAALRPTVPAFVAVNEAGDRAERIINAPNPNLYIVVAIDGAALSRFLAPSS